MGALPPNPRGLSLYRLMDGVKMEKAEINLSALMWGKNRLDNGVRLNVYNESGSGWIRRKVF